MYTSTGESTFSTVPAFLTKLWTLVEDPATDELICWDASGRSFHILDQARFAKEILPLYFKHNNIASFIRQLNMYGFRKVISTEAVNTKVDKDDVEFAHQLFVQGQERLLEFIKRKVPPTKVHMVGGVAGSMDDGTAKTNNVQAVLSEVSDVKSRQDNMTVKLENLKLENEVLWREVASLRQMHMKQQHVVSRLIHFLVTVLGNQKHQLNAALKRKAPLMLGAATSGPSPVKVARDRSYQVQSPQASSSSVEGSNVVLDDVPDFLTSDGGDPAYVMVDSTPAEHLATNDVRANVLEPLAIRDRSYPPSLELADIFDNSDEITAVPLEDVLKTPTVETTSINTSLSNTVVTTTAAVTTSSPLLSTTALALTDSKIEFDPHDLTSHLDMTYSQLSGLRELFTGSASPPQINIDPNLMLELFGYLDTSVPSMCTDESSKAEDNEAESNTQTRMDLRPSVIGNEVIQYMPAEDFSSLYDVGDLVSSYQPTFDPAVGDNSVLTTPDDDDILLSLYEASQPGATTTMPNGRRTAAQNTMEDVD